MIGLAGRVGKEQFQPVNMPVAKPIVHRLEAILRPALFGLVGFNLDALLPCFAVGCAAHQTPPDRFNALFGNRVMRRKQQVEVPRDAHSILTRFRLLSCYRAYIALMVFLQFVQQETQLPNGSRIAHVPRKREGDEPLPRDRTKPLRHGIDSSPVMEGDTAIPVESNRAMRYDGAWIWTQLSCHFRPHFAKDTLSTKCIE